MEKWRIVLNQCLKEIKTLKDGEKFLSQREMASKYNVSVITTRKVYNKLIDYGFLISISRKGFFVSKDKSKRLQSYAQLYSKAIPKIVYATYKIHPKLGKCLYYVKNRYNEFNELICVEKSYVSTKFLPSKITPQIFNEINNSLFSTFKKHNLVNIIYSHKQIRPTFINNKPYTRIITNVMNDFDEIVVISNLYEDFIHLNAQFSEILN